MTTSDRDAASDGGAADGGADSPGGGGEGSGRRRRRRRRGGGGDGASDGGAPADASARTPSASSDAPAAESGAAWQPGQPRPPRGERPPRGDRPPRDAAPSSAPRAPRPPAQQQQQPAAARGPRDGGRRDGGGRRDARPEAGQRQRPAGEPRTAREPREPREPRPRADDAIVEPRELGPEPTAPVDDTPTVAWGSDDGGPVADVALRDDLGPVAAADELDASTAGAGAGASPRAGDVVIAVGVRVTVAGRVQPCDAGDLDLKVGDRIIVEGERGPRLGTVATPPHRLQPRERLRRITRVATADDLAAAAGERPADRRALRHAKDRAAAMRLPIKVFRVEHHDGTPQPGDRPDRGGRMVVHYTSDDRVEVGGLARDLTMATGARVELRAIGARDEAKAIGGIGTCGLELCCSTWLPDFVPVSIKMAKDQGLVLNPQKVAGQCGRLKCCLVYEQATYAEMRKGLPKLGKRVITTQGEGRVVEVDVLRQRVRVSYGMGESEVLPATEVRPMFPAGGGGTARADGSRGRRGAEPEHDDDDDAPDPPSAAELQRDLELGQADAEPDSDVDDLAVGGDDDDLPA